MFDISIVYLVKANRCLTKTKNDSKGEKIMKRKLFTTIATITVATALSLGTVACTDGLNNKNNGGADGFTTSADFFAVSAVSGANFLNAETNNSTSKVAYTADVATVRPEEFTDDNVAEIKNTLVMFDSIVGGGISSDVQACTEADGDFAVYAYKMTVNFGKESAVMYYDETSTKTEVDDDDDEPETETTLKGVLVSGEKAYETDGKRKEEVSADEKEFELELVIRKSVADYVKFTYSTETETGEHETTYECEIYENGRKIQETEIEIEVENGKTEISFELEQDGKSDGVEYKIVKRGENKFDVRREQNGKKSFILAEKTETGYTFTYSNGFSENLA